MQVVTELLEFITVELFAIIRYNGIGHPVSADNVFVHELLNLGRRDGHECFGFNPFDEVVDSHYSILNTTSPFEKLAN